MPPSSPDSAHRRPLPHSSGSTIISQSSTTSLTLPSPSPKPNGNPKIVVPLSAPPEALGHSALGRLSFTISNKRKRDSVPRNASQLREAQEKVEQKRAKIAARVPSAMAPGSAGPTQATVTSLADLYAQMRRDSGQPGQQDASDVLPSPGTLSGNERASFRRVQNAPRGHSSGSSPDPIAISGDDSEIVMLRHIPPSPAQVRDRSKPIDRLAPPTRLKRPSKVESRTATPKSTTGKRIDKEVLDEAPKPKHSFAVVVPSPPKLPTLKPARLKQHLSVSDSSQSQDGTLANPPTDNKPIDKLKEITNNALEPVSDHTTLPALARPARPAETISDSIPEYVWFKRSRREPLSAWDIDILLGAVPVPFDFSLSRHHLAASEKGEGDVEEGEESSLWWYHPKFEARAKADIRRTLRALLPADPVQDPPLPGAGADGWRAEIRPRQSRARMWTDRLEEAFGPGPLDRGIGRKPRRKARPAGLARRVVSESSRSYNAAAVAPPGALVIATLPTTGHRILEPPSRRISPHPQDGADEVVLRPPDTDAEVPLAEAVSTAGEGEAAAAAAWTAALLPLVKGKTKLDRAKMALTSEALGEVERADERGGIAREVLKESALADTVRRLGELEGVPLGDAHGLRARARTLAERWRGAFGDEVVDLQQSVLLPVTL